MTDLHADVNAPSPEDHREATPWTPPDRISPPPW